MIEAFRFHQRIGRKIHALNEQSKEGLTKMRYVKLYTPWGSTLSAGLICFDVNGMQPKAVVKRLLRGEHYTVRDFLRPPRTEPGEYTQRGRRDAARNSCHGLWVIGTPRGYARISRRGIRYEPDL
jgi:selenocysteine lyase/cysteine desulfurase